jgi:hypothetical protein
MRIELRPGTSEDAVKCGRICFDAFKITFRHAISSVATSMMTIVGAN